MKLNLRATLLAVAFTITGCASSTSAVIDSLRYAVQGDSKAVDRIALNPRFRYLRVSVSGRTALLVLGYTDDHPLGPVEVWYSAEREVLRIQNGRIVGALGTTTEWRNVTLSASPMWSAVAGAKGGQLRLRRVRDEMPGYRLGVEEDLLVGAIPTPTRSALLGADARHLAWFAESVISTDGAATAGAPDPIHPARYAVRIHDGVETVVYGEQCLAPALCLTWQRWPVPGTR